MMDSLQLSLPDNLSVQLYSIREPLDSGQRRLVKSPIQTLMTSDHISTYYQV